MRRLLSERDKIKRRIDTIALEAGNIQDFEIKSEMAKYITVLVSGYVECSCRYFVHLYCSKRANEQITRYIDKDMERFTNPRWDKISDLLGRFGIQVDTDDSEREAVNSVVGNRHLIAHGKDAPNVTLSRIIDYFSRIERIMKKLEQTLT